MKLCRQGSPGAEELEREARAVPMRRVQVLPGLAHQVLRRPWYAENNTFALYVAVFRASGWFQLIVCAFGPVIFLHDPVSFAALVRPDLFTFRKGVVRVETQGICAGHTSMDMLLKK